MGLCIYRDTPVFSQVMPQWVVRNIDWTVVEQEMQLPAAIEAKAPKPLNVVRYPTYTEQMSPPPRNVASLSDDSTPDTVTVQAAAEDGKIVTRSLSLTKKTPRLASELIAERKKKRLISRNKKRQREDVNVTGPNVNVTFSETPTMMDPTLSSSSRSTSAPVPQQALSLPEAVAPNVAVANPSNRAIPQQRDVIASFPNLHWNKSKLDSRLELGASYTRGMISKTVHHSSNDGQTRKVRMVCKLYGKYPER